MTGRELLNRSPLNALSLFHYDPSVGAVVDLRNFTVGGNMRRYSLIARRMMMALSCTFVASMAIVASAQAVVVTRIGGTEAGVALVAAHGLPATR